MRFYKVREEILKGKNIAELPLRVTFYARVSTETDEQLNSLDNQISFFENFINIFIKKIHAVFSRNAAISVNLAVSSAQAPSRHTGDSP